MLSESLPIDVLEAVSLDFDLRANRRRTLPGRLSDACTSKMPLKGILKTSKTSLSEENTQDNCVDNSLTRLTEVTEERPSRLTNPFRITPACPSSRYLRHTKQRSVSTPDVAAISNLMLEKPNLLLHGLHNHSFQSLPTNDFNNGECFFLLLGNKMININKYTFYFIGGRTIRPGTIRPIFFLTYTNLTLV